MHEVMVIPQNTTCAIHASDVRIDGDLVDLTGWSIRAELREQPSSALLAEWSNVPTAGQGAATSGDGELDLLITPDLSSAWAWLHAVVQCYATEPGPDGRTIRPIDSVIYLSADVS